MAAMDRWRSPDLNVLSTRTRKQLHGNKCATNVFTTVESLGPPQRQKQSDVSPDVTCSATLSPSRDSVPLLRASRFEHGPSRSRAQPLSETFREDRTAILKLQDKFATSKHTYLQKVFKAYDPEGKGTLTADALHAALTRLNLGISSDDISRVVTKLQPGGTDAIPYQSLFDWAHNMAPLGTRQLDSGQPTPPTVQGQSIQLLSTNRPLTRPSAAYDQGVPHVPHGVLVRPHTTPSVSGGAPSGEGALSVTSNARTRAPWEPLRGRLKAWNWQLRPQGLAGVTGPAEPGSYEQKKQDALLISLVSEKLSQSLDKLRRTFRKWDTSRNGQLSCEEFVGALEAMHLNVPRQQLERLFEMADSNKSGEVDYTEFVNTFDSGKPTRTINPAENNARVSLAETMDPPLTPEEVDQVFRSQLCQDLSTKLAAKATAAHAVFGAYDTNRDGYLSLSELTSCCQALVPGMTERQVAALLTAADPSGDGYLNYKEFVGRLVDAAPPHPRMMHQHMAGPGVSHMEQRPTWGHSPLCTQALKPSSLGGPGAPQHSPSMAVKTDDQSGQTTYTATRRLDPKPVEDPGPFPDTVWTKDNLPAPGYTGTLKPDLREQRLQWPDEELRIKRHQASTRPLVDAVLCAGLAQGSDAVPPAEAYVAKNPSLEAGALLTMADEDSSSMEPERSSSPVRATTSPTKTRPQNPGPLHGDGWAPFAVQGCPSLPEQKHSKGRVPGARSLHMESQSECCDSRGRRQLDHPELHPEIPRRFGNPAGDAELWPVGDSVRMTGSVNRLASRRPATTGHLPQTSTLSKGKMRFSFLSNLDTTHMTQVAPTCSQWCDPNHTWVRKSDSDFMAYQQEDRLKKQKKQQQSTIREAGRIAEQAAKAQASLARAEGMDQARLEIKGMVKTRYIERCAMFNEARAAHVQHTGAILDRDTFFSDHVIIDPILARS